MRIYLKFKLPDEDSVKEKAIVKVINAVHIMSLIQAFQSNKKDKRKVYNQLKYWLSMLCSRSSNLRNS